MLPHYISIGLDHKTILHATPKILQCYDEGYKLQRKIDDEKAWFQGRYNLDAFQVVMSHFGAGLAKKKSNAEYMKSPMLLTIEEHEAVGESQEEVAVYEMKKRTMMLKDSGLPDSPN